MAGVVWIHRKESGESWKPEYGGDRSFTVPEEGEFGLGRKELRKGTPDPKETESRTEKKGDLRTHSSPCYIPARTGGPISCRGGGCNGRGQKEGSWGVLPKPGGISRGGAPTHEGQERTTGYHRQVSSSPSVFPKHVSGALLLLFTLNVI